MSSIRNLPHALNVGAFVSMLDRNLFFDLYLLLYILTASSFLMQYRVTERSCDDADNYGHCIVDFPLNVNNALTLLDISIKFGILQRKYQ